MNYSKPPQTNTGLDNVGRTNKWRQKQTKVWTKIRKEDTIKQSEHKINQQIKQPSNTATNKQTKQNTKLTSK